MSLLLLSFNITINLSIKIKKTKYFYFLLKQNIKNIVKKKLKYNTGIWLQDSSCPYESSLLKSLDILGLLLNDSSGSRGCCLFNSSKQYELPN